MKRVSSACLYQTLSFILDPSLPIEEARAKVISEVKNYKETAAAGDSIQILDELKNEDGSIILSVRKKVSGYPVGNYFD